jgi:hypothetical protein
MLSVYILILLEVSGKETPYDQGRYRQSVRHREWDYAVAIAAALQARLHSHLHV